MVFPTCSRVSSSTGLGTDCYINIAYNQQLKLCSSSTDSGLNQGVRTCRPHDDLCTADPSFKFNLSDHPDNDVSTLPPCLHVQPPPNSYPVLQLFSRFPLSSLYPSSSLLVLDTTFSPPIPLSLKLGDANLDGFPDIIAITGSGNDRVPGLVFSVPCAKDVAGCSASGTGRRGWSVAKDGAEPLNRIKDARVVSFIDLDEDVCVWLVYWHFCPLEADMIVGHLGYYGAEDRQRRTWPHTLCPE